MTDRIFARQFHAAEGAEAWRVLPEGAYAFFRTESFAGSVRFVDAIGGLVREDDPPHVDIRGDGVTVLLRAFRGNTFGLVRTDLELPRAISTIARELVLTADPAAVQSLSVIPGATDRRGIMPSGSGCSATTDGRTAQTRISSTRTDAWPRSAGNEVDVATVSAPDQAV